MKIKKKRLAILFFEKKMQTRSRRRSAPSPRNVNSKRISKPKSKTVKKPTQKAITKALKTMKISKNNKNYLIKKTNPKKTVLYLKQTNTQMTSSKIARKGCKGFIKIDYPRNFDFIKLVEMLNEQPKAEKGKEITPPDETYEETTAEETYNDLPPSYEKPHPIMKMGVPNQGICSYALTGEFQTSYDERYKILNEIPGTNLFFQVQNLSTGDFKIAFLLPYHGNGSDRFCALVSNEDVNILLNEVITNKHKTLLSANLLVHMETFAFLNFNATLNKKETKNVGIAAMVFPYFEKCFTRGFVEKNYPREFGTLKSELAKLGYKVNENNETPIALQDNATKLLFASDAILI